MKAVLFPMLLCCILTSGTLYAQGTNEKYAINSQELENWVSYLASDEMKGRQNGSPEMKEAAEWITHNFHEFGIQPVFTDGQLIRPYTFQTRRGDAINERNIVGIIEGTDPKLKDEYIIVTAHFDHVGIRDPLEGDSIYNGADDNAAGTCTLLGVAKIIHENKHRPGRSILFAAVSGEEMGLHGSRYLASNMPLPIRDAYVNINFEMTGHSEDLGPGYYYMTGCSFSNLDETIKTFQPENYHHLVDTISRADRLFYGSDNVAFAMIERNGEVSSGIPGGTLVTSLAARHIHTPMDEADLFDFENMAGLVNYFAQLILWLSHSEQEITWTDPGFTRIN